MFSDRSATPTPTITPTPIPISINVEKALLGIPPIHPADPVTYAITITNTGPSEIIHLPLADIYDPAILTYLGAHPAGDDGIDDGRIDWTDLTVPFGDLEPGGSVTVDVLFELAATGSGLTVANLAEVAGAENQSGGQASGADDFRFVLDCTNLGIPQTGIGFDPPRATPGDLVSVRFQVRNDGQFPTTGGRVSVAYEGTPLEPSDDPNPHEIDSVMLDGIEPGAVEEHSVTWDTIGLSAVRIPLYFQLFDVLPAECTAEYNTTVVIYTVPVELVSWSAVAGDGEVILEWVTETEADLLGWRIFRSERYDGVYQRLNPALVPGHGTRFVRHRYEYVDEDVVNTGLYFYRLESIDLAGGTERSSVVAASPGPGAAGAPTLRLMARRSRGVAGDALELRAAVEGGDVSREALVGIWLLLDGEVLGEVLPPTPVRIPASFSGEGLVWEHSLDGTEPPGTYELVGALLSPDSAGVISMSVASVHRWRR